MFQMVFRNFKVSHENSQQFIYHYSSLDAADSTVTRHVILVVKMD
jgi:hypothetical protein